MQIITETLANGTVYTAKITNGRYTWFCGASEYIQDNEAGRSIYQLSYLRNGEFGSDPLPADVEIDIKAFWAGLRPLIAAGKESARRAADAAHDDRESRNAPMPQTMLIMGEDW